LEAARINQEFLNEEFDIDKHSQSGAFFRPLANKPVAVLKNQTSINISATRKGSLRKTLTVSQFVVAQFLIMATILVSKQISFSLNKDMGFKKDAIVYIVTS
jgi:hypothetical protein